MEVGFTKMQRNGLRHSCNVNSSHQITRNGWSSPKFSIVVDRLKREEVGVGFNAADGQWVNMMQAGIVDSTKVTRSALQNAASVADLPKKNATPMMPDMGRMGSMM